MWLGTSASAGSSRKVRRNNSDMRVITADNLITAITRYSSPASTASRVCWAAAISRAEKPIQNALMPTSTAIAATHSSEYV